MRILRKARRGSDWHVLKRISPQELARIWSPKFPIVVKATIDGRERVVEIGVHIDEKDIAALQAELVKRLRSDLAYYRKEALRY